MLQTLDIMISMGVIFLILSMVNKYLIGFFKRLLNTKATVITGEMERFIGVKTSKYLKPYLEEKAKYMNLLDDKKRIRQLNKSQIKTLVSDLEKFLKNEDVTEFQKVFGIDITINEVKEEIKEIKGHLNNLKDKIEDMYDNTMEKIAEIYEKKMRYITLITGLILAFVVNADLFNIYVTLSDSPATRDKIVAQSDNFKNEMQTLLKKIEEKKDTGLENIEKEVGEAKKEVTTLIGHIENSGIILGWTTAKFNSAINGFWSFISKFIGLLLAGILISFGAPFWHDFIGTFTGLRNTLRGKKAEGPGTKPPSQSNPILS